MHYIQLIIISLAIASISYTISHSELFKPIRFFLCKNINWLGKLISCPYCLSHWISFGLMVYIYKMSIWSALGSLDVFIMTFAAITLSAIWIGMISRSIDFLPPND